MLWIAVHLPQLALEAFAATLAPGQQGQPLALLAGARVLAVNATAAERGVQPGMKRATALALAPSLLAGHAQRAREAALQTAVAHAALAFTPAVALDGDDTILIEVSTTQRLFGGLARLLKRLQLCLAPLVPTQRLATAPTAAGAAALARWGADVPLIGEHTRHLEALRRCLDPAPLALLPAATDQADRLLDMQLHTWADLRALPRDGTARRLGADLLAQLDMARGDVTEAHRWVRLPEHFDARLELFARADTTAQIQHGAQCLLERLVGWARARRARILQIRLAMLHERRHRQDERTPERSVLNLALAEPTLDAAHLATLLHERLQRLPLPAPTLTLELSCHHWVHDEAPSGELFPTRASRQEGLVRLIERLQARLGRENVRRLQRVDDHRPEHATALPPLDPAAASAGSSRSAVAPASAVLTRPVWLLPEPQPLPERGGRPWFEGHPLQRLSGPERIEAGWWDGQVATRDYFVAQAHDGSLVWIFRARLPLSAPPVPAGTLGGAPPPAGRSAAWYLHGRFA